MESRLVRFAIVGTMCTVLDFSMLFGLLKFGCTAVLANTLSFLAATFLNYLLSRAWVYVDGKNVGFGVFLIGATSALVVNDAAFVVIGIVAPVFVAKIMATALSTIWNWFTRKRMFGV